MHSNNKFFRLCSLVLPAVLMLSLVSSSNMSITSDALAAEEKEEIKESREKAKERVKEGKEDKEDYVADEIIVRYKGDREKFRIVKLPIGKNVNDAEKEYESRGDVEYAEPNYVARAFYVPNDPYYKYQWNMYNETYGGIHAEHAWDVSDGSNVTVAVVDTGVAYENYTNPSTGKSYYKAPDLSSTCFVPGYDFIENDSHPNDDNAHGTHVAGTIAQSSNNSAGVAGVAYKACIQPIKVLDSAGSGSYAAVAAGIRYAADNGAKVINLSLGGSNSSQALLDAVAYAHGKGVTIIAAAGNEKTSVPSYPASYDDYVISVGATRYDETLASYSNYGPSMDLVAPGGDTSVDQNRDGYIDGILQNTFSPSTKNTSSFGYWFLQGTSMASPHVAGVAAMVISKGIASSPTDVKNVLQTTADDLGVAGRDDTYGFGIVNAEKAVGVGSSPDPQPTPQDQLPVVSISSPVADSVVSGSVTIAASASDDVSVSRVEFYINDVLLGSDSSSPYSISWNTGNISDGVAVIKVIAFDNTLQSAASSINVQVSNSVNQPPIADAGSNKTAFVGDVVVFDGSASIDPDGSIVNYSWNFGDGTTGSGVTSNHAYGAAGNYTATLVVTDNYGLTSQSSVQVAISNKVASPAMHVGNIRFAYEKRFYSGCRVTATIPILDANSRGVASSAVYGSWSGAFNRNVAKLTNSAGSVSFRTDWVRNCGLFQFSVNNVAKTGWVYDSASNIETSDAIWLSRY